MVGLPQPRSTSGLHSRHHLEAVADLFLDPVQPLDRAASAAVRPSRKPCVYAAAPGTSDTAAVLAALVGVEGSLVGADLGPAIGTRLSRLEGGDGAAQPGAASVLIWCPRGNEGLSVVAALALGRLASLLQPARLTVLWFAAPASVVGREPERHSRERVEALVQTAVPGAAVAVHCLGWTGPAAAQLEELARRFA